MAITILLNGFWILLESKLEDSHGESDIWLIIEILFTIIFVFECVVKLIAYKLGYWQVTWNCFDFVLAILAVFGVVMDLISQEHSSSGGGTSALKAARVLKVARLLRLVRLFNMIYILYLKLDKHELDLVNGENLRRFTALTSFIRAHLHAQRDLIKLLAPDYQVA